MERYKATKKVAIFGIACNLFLFFLKIIFAVISKSQGMLADSLMSITDVFTSLLTYIGNKLAQKKKDKKHPDGHGKIEYIFTLIISMCMIILAFTILYNSVKAIIVGELIIFSWNLVIVCLVTIILKLLLYLYTSKLGKKYNSLIILANSEDHRNDMFLTMGSLGGIIFSIFNIYIFDSIAGIMIGIWIVYISLKLFKSAYDVLIDTDISESIEDEVNSYLNSLDIKLNEIKTKPIGVSYMMIIKISINENIKLNEIRELIRKIKVRLKRIEKIEDVLIELE